MNKEHSYRFIVPFPIASMYGIFTNIYHKIQPNVGKFTSAMDAVGLFYLKTSADDFCLLTVRGLYRCFWTWTMAKTSENSCNRKTWKSTK